MDNDLIIAHQQEQERECKLQQDSKRLAAIKRQERRKIESEKIQSATMGKHPKDQRTIEELVQFSNRKQNKRAAADSKTPSAAFGKYVKVFDWIGSKGIPALPVALCVSVYIWILLSLSLNVCVYFPLSLSYTHT